MSKHVRKYVVMSGKGGIAKSNTAIALAEVYQAEQGSLPVMYDLDQENKFRRFMGETVNAIRLPELATAATSKALLMKVWDALEPAMKSDADIIVDLGANLDRPFIDWAAKSNIGAVVDHEVVAVVPVQPEAEAVQHALFALKAMQETFDPVRLVLVETRATPGLSFEDVGKSVPGVKQLLATPGLIRVRIETFPNEPFWRSLETAGISFAQAAGLTTPKSDTKADKKAAINRFAERFGIRDDEGGLAFTVASRTIVELNTWAEAVYSEVGKILSE